MPMRAVIRCVLKLYHKTIQNERFKQASLLETTSLPKQKRGVLSASFLFSADLFVCEFLLNNFHDCSGNNKLRLLVHNLSFNQPEAF